jgi:hypothetical protein
VVQLQIGTTYKSELYSSCATKKVARGVASICVTDGSYHTTALASGGKVIVAFSSTHNGKQCSIIWAGSPKASSWPNIPESRAKKNQTAPSFNLLSQPASATRLRSIIAKLDRLARNVAFIANLMESGVEFVAVDNPMPRS